MKEVVLKVPSWLEEAEAKKGFLRFLMQDAKLKAEYYRSSIKPFERKYAKTYSDFKEEVESAKEESFEAWDDLIEWEAYHRTYEGWTQKYEELRYKMNINQNAYNHYWQKGWAVVEGVYEPAEVERIAQLAVEVSDTELNAASENYVADRADDGSIAPRKISQPFFKERAFQSFVLDSRLSELIRELIGVEPLLMTDQIFMKPPHFGSAKPYHQDNYYFKCHPADHVITAWIAMDDVDVSNGCLRYIEGSHKGPVLPHETPDPDEPYNLVPPPELIDLSKEALALVRKGGVVFHHCKTLHTSHRNESNRWRRGYATHWASAQTTSEGDTVKNAYFRRDDFPQSYIDYLG